MIAAVLAAGDGIRLQTGSRHVLKPLVEIGGKPLLRRTIEELIASGASEVRIIVNESALEVRERMLAHRWPVPVRFTVRSTPSSMHSLLALRPGFGGEDVLVSMVDSILPPGSLAPLVARARARSSGRTGSDATLGVTAYIDDEKPLHVRLRGDRIVSIGTGLRRAAWATAGIYYLTASVWPALDRAEALGLSRMRLFLGHLLEEGYRLHAHRLPQVVDVDRPEDVRAAEEAVAGWGHPPSSTSPEGPEWEARS